jgi:hypothetical protein
MEGAKLDHAHMTVNAQLSILAHGYWASGKQCSPPIGSGVRNVASRLVCASEASRALARASDAEAVDWPSELGEVRRPRGPYHQESRNQEDGVGKCEGREYARDMGPVSLRK